MHGDLRIHVMRGLLLVTHALTALSDWGGRAVEEILA